MKVRAASVLLLLLLATLPGCGVVEPFPSERFSPPAAYVDWVGDFLRCIGRDDADAGKFVAGLEWRASPDLGRGDSWVRAGRYDPNGPTVMIQNAFLNSPHVVKHELAHHLLPGDHDPNHESPWFALCAVDWIVSPPK